MNALGIDIGGTGIKGAPVNVETGERLAERFRIPTPQPSLSNAVADAGNCCGKTKRRRESSRR